MKRNTATTIFIASILVVMISTFVISNNRTKRLERQLHIEKAKTEFALSKFKAGEVPYDSVYSHNDTVLYYKNSTLIGSSIITFKN